jgi:hypothetical protein
MGRVVGAILIVILASALASCGDRVAHREQAMYASGFDAGRKQGFKEGYDSGVLVAAPHRDERLAKTVKAAYRWASIIGGGLILITLAVVTLYLVFRNEVEAATASIGALAALGAIAAFFLSPAAGVQAGISEQLFLPAGGKPWLNLLLAMLGGVVISWLLHAAIKTLRGMVLDGAMAVVMASLCVLVGQQLFVAWSAGSELWSFRAGAVLVGGCLGAGFFFAFRTLAAVATEQASAKRP